MVEHVTHILEHSLQCINKQLLGLRDKLYIVKPETQHIEKNTKTARKKFTVHLYIVNK
jgi:hypothetical protein